MSTICPTASSCPTINFSSVRSSDSASLPVRVGSKILRSRLIYSDPLLSPEPKIDYLDLFSSLCFLFLLRSKRRTKAWERRCLYSIHRQRLSIPEYCSRLLFLGV